MSKRCRFQPGKQYPQPGLRSVTSSSLKREPSLLPRGLLRKILCEIGDPQEMYGDVVAVRRAVLDVVEGAEDLGIHFPDDAGLFEGFASCGDIAGLTRINMALRHAPAPVSSAANKEDQQLAVIIVAMTDRSGLLDVASDRCCRGG